MINKTKQHMHYLNMFKYLKIKKEKRKKRVFKIDLIKKYQFVIIIFNIYKYYLT